MGAYLPDDKDLKEEQTLLNDPVYRAERSYLIDLLTSLEQARTHEQFVDLHRSLLTSMLRRQALIKNLRDRQEARRSRIAALALRRPKPVTELTVQGHHVAGERQAERVELALQALLRTVGDGLAWRILGYDRRAIRIIGRGERVAWLSEGVGLAAELEALEEFWGQGAFAILNDMTNCLRHGDLTVVRPEDRTLELVEVKVADREKPAQVRRMEEVAGVLNQGWHPTAANGSPLHLKEVSASYITHLSQLAVLCRQARRVGQAWMLVADSMLVRVIDVAWAGDTAAYQAALEDVRAAVPWFGDSQSTIEFMSAIRRMRDRRHSFSALAPLSIFPLEPEDLADLMMGNLELVTVLNGKLLESDFGKAGMGAIVELGAERFNKFADVRRGTMTVQIPAEVREQMFLELLAPEAVIAATSELLDELEQQPETGSEARLLTFSTERTAWNAIAR